jgi:hypothetical protein
LGKIRNDLGDHWNDKGVADLEVAATSTDRENSHLGKIGNDLGESWNDKGVGEVAGRLGTRQPLALDEQGDYRGPRSVSGNGSPEVAQ